LRFTGRIALVLIAAVVALGACSSEDGDGSSSDPTEPSGPRLPDVIYTATIEKSEFKDKGEQKLFAGDWTLTFEDPNMAIERGTTRIFEPVEPTPDGFLIEADPAPKGVYNCFDENGDRLLGTGEASAEYEFEIESLGFTLKAIDDPCPLRVKLLERFWQTQG
jgi:hypothetical protein